MKHALLHITIILLLISCGSKEQKNTDRFIERYIEEQSPFTNLFNYRIKNNTWIRDSENILIVHETFKKGFYQRYMTPAVLDDSPSVNGFSYNRTSLRERIDSLIITHPSPQTASKYYKEFWNRRISENNDSIVHLVLNEIQQFINGESLEVREEFVSQKLKHMINIVSDWETEMVPSIALNHFDFLRQENMHQSAYNLLYENVFYDEIIINKDSLKSTLTKEKLLLKKATLLMFLLWITQNDKLRPTIPIRNAAEGYRSFSAYTPPKLRFDVL